MAAGLSYCSKPAVCLLSLILAAYFLTSETLGEGILLGDENATLSGRVDFLFNEDNDADVEYAVYAPGLTFPGGPGNLGEYIYAYQIFVAEVDGIESPFVSGLTVHLDGDEEAKNRSFLDGSGDKSPSGGSLGGNSVLWNFNSSNFVREGQTSDVLYFSSPFGPEDANATLWRTTTGSEVGCLPSPGNSTPEPATLTLFGIAGVLLFLFRPTRR